MIAEEEKSMSNKEKHDDRIKVSYSYIDFTPLIFKRKMIKLRDAENKDETFDVPLLNRGELIHITD